MHLLHKTFLEIAHFLQTTNKIMTIVLLCEEIYVSAISY